MAIKKSKSAPAWLWKATHMKEAELQEAVVEYVQKLGWGVSWIPDWLFNLAMYTMKKNPRSGKVWSPPGIPDLTLTQPLKDSREPARLVYMELKSQKGFLREPQLRWIESIQRVPGVEIYVIVPTDWLDGTVNKIMEGGPMPNHQTTIDQIEKAQKKFGKGMVNEGGKDGGAVTQNREEESER